MKWNDRYYTWERRELHKKLFSKNMKGKFKFGELSLDGQRLCATLYYILYRLKYRVVRLQVTLSALSVLTASVCHNDVTSLISLLLTS
jgi:hypothetical protein